MTVGQSLVWVAEVGGGDGAQTVFGFVCADSLAFCLCGVTVNIWVTVLLCSLSLIQVFLSLSVLVWCIWNSLDLGVWLMLTGFSPTHCTFSPKETLFVVLGLGWCFCSRLSHEFGVEIPQYLKGYLEFPQAFEVKQSLSCLFHHRASLSCAHKGA